MPKIRPSALSLIDAQRHITVFRARISKGNNYELLKRVDKVVTDLHSIISDLPQEEKELQSLSDKAISDEINLINKEVKKEIPKIDYRSAVRAMCNADSISNAKRIGLEYNIPTEQVDQVIKKAPPNTNLGRAVIKYKSKLKLVPTLADLIEKEIPKQTIVFNDEGEPTVTNDSDDVVVGDELQQLLLNEEG